jgi:hypothetical protein
MKCANGRVEPDLRTKLRLFADAAGYCQRPDCRKRLFSDEGGPDYNIAEMAHIFAASDSGPRADKNLPGNDRAGYANLILLCPNCHTEIDKNQAAFPDELLREWKRTHKEKIRAALGAAEFASRREARGFIEPLLQRNRVIYETLGPDNAYRENPEAEEARVWRRKMLSQIIPNNQALLVALDLNVSLMRPEERATAELFRQHVDDLIERHLGEDRMSASRFPLAMSTMFSDN